MSKKIIYFLLSYKKRAQDETFPQIPPEIIRMICIYTGLVKFKVPFMSKIFKNQKIIRQLNVLRIYSTNENNSLYIHVTEQKVSENIKLKNHKECDKLNRICKLEPETNDVVNIFSYLQEEYKVFDVKDNKIMYWSYSLKKFGFFDINKGTYNMMDIPFEYKEFEVYSFNCNSDYIGIHVNTPVSYQSNNYLMDNMRKHIRNIIAPTNKDKYRFDNKFYLYNVESTKTSSCENYEYFGCDDLKLLKILQTFKHISLFDDEFVNKMIYKELVAIKLENNIITCYALKRKPYDVCITTFCLDDDKSEHVSKTSTVHFYKRFTREYTTFHKKLPSHNHCSVPHVPSNEIFAINRDYLIEYSEKDDSFIFKPLESIVDNINSRDH